MSQENFNKALAVGRPPNIVKLFPNSKALIVSGKVIDRALLAKGKAMTIAANARNRMVIRGALLATQKANAALIIEIAKSEGGTGAYCAVNYWNIATYIDAICNELNITVPVAVHADHYAIKGDKDVETAKVEIPSMFAAGITSIAIDASHLPDDQNLLANIDLNPCIPKWAGLETEVGEIKGKLGLSTLPEAQFLIKGLNAHGIAPDWIALNNGTVHGIEESGAGIQVKLTQEIHEGIQDYKVSGAQHGTSGNSSERLREIASSTHTTKANVATALQMVSWGVDVNDYGNAILDENKNFVKRPNAGVTPELWDAMMKEAEAKGWSGGNIKKLSLLFDNRIMSQPAEIQERMVADVRDFVYNMLINVFSAQDTAPLAIDAILKAGTYDLGSKVEQIENPSEWTRDQIIERAKNLDSDKGPEGDFED